MGLIHCYTGDGKGKTTAAVGLAVRAAGSGMKVLFTQFLKDGSSGEIKVLSAVPGIRCYPCPKHFGFFRDMTDSQKKEAEETYRNYFSEAVQLAADGAYDVLVLDELMAAYDLKLLDRERVLSFLKTKPEKLEIIMTGRNMPDELASLCDYITECRKIRHPYDRGIPARKGIEL